MDNGLYNGNIRHSVLAMDSLNFPNLGYIYKYDQLNRLTAQRAYSGLDTTSHEWTTASVLEDYVENVKYDPNGNILMYERNGTTNSGPFFKMDSLNYNYIAGTNKLDHVDDAINPLNYPDDIDGQSNGNYQYDANGNLVYDSGDNVQYDWTNIGKLFATYTAADLSYYFYDPMGNRIETFTEHLGINYDQFYYVRDAQGNIMATYILADGWEYKLKELNIYGSSRLGVLKLDTIVYDSSTPIQPDFYSAWSGRKMYELTNHLGNVLATVTDKKVLFDNNNDNVADWSVPEISTANDYYPFGMLMPGRTLSAEDYRFGFNDKENLNDVKGVGKIQDYGMRIYDPRLGKFLSVDPLTKSFPDLTPYQFGSNTPIMAIDLDGLEAWIATQKWSKQDKKGYSTFAEAQLKKYTEAKLKDDCADLAIRLISEYAFEKKLPISFITANGQVISNETKEFNGVQIREGNKEDFIKVAQDFTNAEALAKNTYAVENKNCQAGDLRIMLQDDFHHAMIISDPENQRVVYGGGSAGFVVEGPDFSAMTDNAAGVGNASRLNVFKEFEGKKYTPPPIDDSLEGVPQN